MFGTVIYVAVDYFGPLFAQRAWTFGGSACIDPAPHPRAPRLPRAPRPRLYRVQARS